MSDDAPAAKPVMKPVAARRRLLTRVSLDDTFRALHGHAVARDMLASIREMCDRAAEHGQALKPAALRDWIDEHNTQFDPVTALKMEE
jgi:hypothetical protein